MPAVTRFRQGVRALTAWTRPVEWALVESVLVTPELLALFRRLRRSEQLHALNVLRAVRAAGETDSDLAVAALLHDVGKTVAPFTLPERVMVVLVRRFLPRQYRRWGQGEPYGWRRAFVISQRHPVWSAEKVARAGGSERAVLLCRRHAEPLPGPPRDEFERLLGILQAVDDVN